jgi:hypothetical protein
MPATLPLDRSWVKLSGNELGESYPSTNPFVRMQLERIQNTIDVQFLRSRAEAMMNLLGTLIWTGKLNNLHLILPWDLVAKKKLSARIKLI